MSTPDAPLTPAPARSKHGASLARQLVRVWLGIMLLGSGVVMGALCTGGLLAFAACCIVSLGGIAPAPGVLLVLTAMGALGGLGLALHIIYDTDMRAGG